MPTVIRLRDPISHGGKVTDCCTTTVKAAGKPMAVVSFPVTRYSGANLQPERAATCTPLFTALFELPAP